MTPERIALVPARLGSKAVPQKNLRNFLGSPLVAHTVEAAIRSMQFSRIVLSTEADEVGEAVRGMPVEVFKRPETLANDDASTAEVILDFLARGGVGADDLICLLQPCSPLRLPEDIRRGFDLLQADPCALSVISVCAYILSPVHAFQLDGGYIRHHFPDEFRVKGPRRQDGARLFHPNGAIYITSARVLRKNGGTFITKHTLALPMPQSRSIDIDTEFDFAVAEFIGRTGRNLGNEPVAG